MRTPKVHTLKLGQDAGAIDGEDRLWVHCSSSGSGQCYIAIIFLMVADLPFFVRKHVHFIGNPEQNEIQFWGTDFLFSGKWL